MQSAYDMDTLRINEKLCPDCDKKNVEKYKEKPRTDIRDE